jgi:NAD(P)-dependent dehydrogenase (short-subunit alcohol dehydrogenase family)
MYDFFSKSFVIYLGCDSGFGLKLALRLNSMGVKVYAGVLNDDGEGAKELKTQGCEVLKVDVTKDAYVLKAAEYIKEHLGSKSNCFYTY